MFMNRALSALLHEGRWTLDDVERISKGKASKAKTGSRKVPHRLQAGERTVFLHTSPFIECVSSNYMCLNHLLKAAATCEYIRLKRKLVRKEYLLLVSSPATRFKRALFICVPPCCSSSGVHRSLRQSSPSLAYFLTF